MDSRTRAPHSVILQPRDIQLLRWLLQDFVALTRPQISRLFPGRDIRNTNRRLRRLVEDGYLSCRTLPTLLSQPVLFYYLGPKAYEGLNLPKDDPSISAQIRRSKRLAERNLAHFALTNDVHIKFLTAEQVYHDHKLISWIPGEHPHWQVLSRFGLSLRPDAYAEYEKGSFIFRAFIEVDRGSEHASTLHQKLTAYQDYGASGRFSRHFAASSFHVLFIVPSGRRRNFCLRAFRAYDPGLFWASTFHDFFSHPLFHPVWESTDSQLPHDLSEPPPHQNVQSLQDTLAP